MAASALKRALIAPFGARGRVPRPMQLRAEYGLVFTSRHYTRLVRSHGLKQEGLSA